MKTKIIKSVSLSVLALLFFVFPKTKIPVVDNRTDQYFTEAIQKAGLAYATTRVLNASISVIKNSELRLEPGGVGLSVAVGQVVDPIDDMTERLSDVLVTAIASIGVQRLLYEIGLSVAPNILATLLLLFSVLIWFEAPKTTNIRRFLLGVTTIIVVARLFLPISSLISSFLYTTYFQEDISNARKSLALASNELDKLTSINLPEIEGFAGTIKNSALFLKDKTIEFKDTLVVITRNMGGIVSNLLTLTWLYAGIFFIQVIALPILMFWLLIKTANALFSLQISTTISPRKSIKAAMPETDSLR